MNCTNCGAKLEDIAKFCGVCGTPVKVNELTQEPAYTAPAYATQPPESTYTAPAYATQPQEPTYPAPTSATQPQEPAYTAPAPPPQEPTYPAPAYAPPPQEPTYPAPAYAPQPQEPTYPAPTYAPPPQGQAYSSPAYTPPPYGGPPPGATPGGGKKGINLKILIPVAAAVLLLAVFAGLWFFTDIFKGASGGGKVSPPPEPPPITSTTPESPKPTPTETPTPEPPAPSVREGYYRLVSLEMEGVDMIELYEALGMSTERIYLEIRSGGIIVMAAESETMEGTYRIDGNRIILIDADSDETQEGTYEDGIITFEMDEGILMSFQWDPTFVPPPVDDYEPWLDPSLEVLKEGPNQIRGAGFYRFVPSQPGYWEFRTTDSGDGDPRLTIYNSIGNELDSDDDSGGGYDALVSVYIFDAVVVEVAFWDSNTSTTLEIGPDSGRTPVEVVEGFIPPGGGVVAIRETQTLEFTMDTAGFWVFYTMHNGSSDPYLTLYDHDGDFYSDDDDGMGDYNALLIVYFDEGEPGSIEAGFALGGEGYYELVVKPPETLPGSGGTFVVDAPQTFVFTPDRSGTWVFETSDGADDPFIEIFDESGNVWEDDDSGSGLNAKLSIELVAGERYHINASFKMRGPTTYTLTVS